MLPWFQPANQALIENIKCLFPDLKGNDQKFN
jgi:hypothetical protein